MSKKKKKEEKIIFEFISGKKFEVSEKNVIDYSFDEMSAKAVSTKEELIFKHKPQYAMFLFNASKKFGFKEAQEKIKLDELKSISIKNTKEYSKEYLDLKKCNIRSMEIDTKEKVIIVAMSDGNKK